MRPASLPRFVVLSTALAACRAGENTQPPLLPPAIEAPSTVVYPAASYAITTLADTGWLSDVNDRKLMVGTISTAAGSWVHAFALPPGGTPKLLAHGGLAAAAMAVNSHGAIVGTVDYGYTGIPATLDNRPAVWADASSAPLVAPIKGIAYDINDHGLVVGTTFNKKGQFAGFVWDTTGQPVLLPPLRGGSSTQASAVNADRVILGSSDSQIGWVYVLWRFNGTTWVPRAISGISAFALDDGATVVGQTAGQASFGTPHHAGFFGVGLQSYAVAVTRDGKVAVGPAWYPVTGPAAAGNSFVADRSGAVTILPTPNSWWTTVTARSINSCGLIVGSMKFNSMSPHPAYWNPGC